MTTEPRFSARSFLRLLPRPRLPGQTRLLKRMPDPDPRLPVPPSDPNARFVGYA